MSFTQEKRINIGKFNVCDGCDEHCKFGFDYEVKVHCHDRFMHIWPTIGGNTVKNYIDEYGNTVKTKPIIANVVKAGGRSLSFNLRKEVTERARQIAKLCDKYKLR